MCGASFVTGLFLQRTAGLLAYRLLFATRVCLSLRLFEKEPATNFWRQILFFESSWIRFLPFENFAVSD
jgi:hypothetical protein